MHNLFARRGLAALPPWQPRSRLTPRPLAPRNGPWEREVGKVFLISPLSPPSERGVRPNGASGAVPGLGKHSPALPPLRCLRVSALPGQRVMHLLFYWRDERAEASLEKKRAVPRKERACYFVQRRGEKRIRGRHGRAIWGLGGSGAGGRPRGLGARGLP